MKHNLVKFFLISACLITGSAWAQDSSDAWVIRLSPYVWGTALNGDSAIEPSPPLPLLDLDLSFGDIISDVNMAFSAHTEFTKNKWTFVVDPTYVQLDIDNVSGPLDMEIDAWFVELWTAYEFYEHWEVIGGLRWQSQDIKVDTIEPLDDEDWTDYFLGLRYIRPISDKWFFTFRGDAVVAGDSDDSLNGEFALSRRIGSSQALFFGYRYYTDDYDSSKYVWDMDQHGPLLGYTWIF